MLRLSPDPGNRTRLTVSGYWINNRWGSRLIDVLECQALWSLLTLLLYIQAHESDIANEKVTDHARPSLCSTVCYHCVSRGHEIKGSHGKLLHPSAERSLPRMLVCGWLCLLHRFFFPPETQNPYLLITICLSEVLLFSRAVTMTASMGLYLESCKTRSLLSVHVWRG